MKRKYRQSQYDDFARMEQGQSQSQSFSPVKTPNTIGGAWEENRGRRSARADVEDMNNPFENGKLHNWNHRQGWDDHFSQRSYREGKAGGGLIGRDHTGRGPKGYKRADESIYEDVCEALSLNPVIDATHIEVSVKNGKISLKGHVESRDIKRLAEFEIEGISGVVDVQNELDFSNEHLL